MTITIVSSQDLKQQLTADSPFLILDTRTYAQYRAGHLPGAHWMGWETWCEAAPAHAGRALAQAGYWGVLKEGEKGLLQDALEEAGVSSDCSVLVYADGPGSKGREGRIAWMLLFWGLSNVYLLDGGWTAWHKQGGRCEKAVPSPTRGHFHIRLQEQRRIRLSQLRHDIEKKSEVVLVDVRSREEFAGYCNWYQPRLGRLPGSVHLPFTKLFDKNGCFVTKDVYLQHLPERIMNAERCIALCEVGVRSCLFALLHEKYTGQVVANYDGSIMEWALERSLPMENGLG